MQAIKDGVARKEMTWQQAYDLAKKDIEHARATTSSLIDNGFIPAPPQDMLNEAMQAAVDAVK